MASEVRGLDVEAVSDWLASAVEGLELPFQQAHTLVSGIS